VKENKEVRSLTSEHTQVT